MFGIRKTLRFGASVFGLSALLLLFMPKFFLDLLNMDSKNESLVWSMQMIGITLVALAGNMWVNSKNSDPSSIKRVGWVMAVCASALGVLTLLIPVSMGWFAIAYAVIGFAFGANYLACLLRAKL
jgi:hypothetical protein